MILFIGNCQAQHISKADVFSREEKQFLLFRTPVLSPGSGFRAAKAYLEQFSPANDLQVLQKHGELVFNPSLSDVESYAPNAIVCTLFHEGPCFELQETKDILSVLDTPRTRNCDGLGSVLASCCRKIPESFATYLERFEAFALELLKISSGPLVVIKRLRHYPIFVPNPTSSLQTWEEDQFRADALYNRLREHSVHFVDVNSVAAEVYARTKKISSVCDALMMSSVSTQGCVSYSLSLDMEHLSSEIWEGVARQVHRVIETGKPSYTVDETIMPTWTSHSTERYLIAVEDTLDALESTNPTRQHRALLEIAYGSPVANEQFAKHMYRLSLNKPSVKALAHVAGRLNTETAEELGRILQCRFSAMDAATGRLFRRFWADECCWTAQLYAASGNQDRAILLFGLALDSLPSDVDIINKALEIIGQLPEATEALLRKKAVADVKMAQMLTVLYRKSERLEEAVSLLTELLSIQRGAPSAMLLRELATTLYSLGRKKEAFQTLERIPMSDNPQSLVPDQRELPSMHALQGHKILCIVLAPLIVLDFLASRMQQTFDVLVSQNVADRVQEMDIDGALFTFPSSGLGSDKDGSPLVEGLAGAQYDAVILLLSRFAPHDYKNGLEIASTLAGKGRIWAFSFEQLWSDALKAVLIPIHDEDCPQ